MAPLPVMLTVLPPALLSVPLPALNVPRASLKEIALVLLPVDDTLVNCRFIPVPLPLMLIAPPEVLLIRPSVTVDLALPTLVPEQREHRTTAAEIDALDGVARRRPAPRRR